MTHKPGRSIRRVIAALASAALVLSACGSGDDDGSASSTMATSETSATAAAGPSTTDVSEPTSQSADLSKAQSDLERFKAPASELAPLPPITGEIPEGLEVYLIATGNETDRLIGEGMSDAANLLGWSVEVINTDRRDPAQATAAVRSALESGADAIVVPSVQAAAIAEGIAEAEEKGVPIVQIGSSEPDQFTGAVNTITANADLYGQIMAAATAADAEKVGQVAHVGILTSGALTFLAPVFDAFTSQLESYCAGCSTELIDAPVAELASGQASTSIVSALQRNPDLNYVLTLGNFAAGVRPGLDSNGYESVKIVGYLPTPALLQEMLDSPDGYVGWVVVPNKYDGFAAVDAVLRAETGGDPTVHNEEAEPLWIVGPDSDFDPSALPELPFDYAEAFAALWGVAG